MKNIYAMRNGFSLKNHDTAITRADFEAHFTKTKERIVFTFNGWDGKSYDGETRRAFVYRPTASRDKAGSFSEGKGKTNRV